jgi:hypothetical protein
MQQLTLEQAADYLEDADLLEEPIRIAHTIINVGVTAAGRRFVLINDCHGYTTVSEGM